MKLTPLEVMQKQFKKVFTGGLDASEVRSFLEHVAREMEEQVRETHRLQETIRQRDHSLVEHKEREALLQTTLTTAQRVSDELKSAARKEQELVLQDAELQAEKIIANAQAKRLALIGEIDELKRAKASFVQTLQSMIDAHRALLEAVTGQEVSKPPPAVATDNVSFFAPPAKR
jgi:cell division initiation protein